MKTVAIPSHIKTMEIFASIQGEGINTGRKTTFVRTLGCNLDCHYCDTGYRPQDDRSRIPHEVFTKGELISRIKFLKSPHICFTGGEPMLHAPFLYDLIETLNDEHAIKFHPHSPVYTFETNGAVLIDKDVDWRIANSVAYTMDVKPFAYEKFKDVYHKNLIALKPRLGDEVKMVITGEADLAFAHRIITQYPNNAYVLSPVTIVETKEFTAEINNLICDYVINMNKSHDVRVGIQAHKILNQR